jgi:hypothetical protein
MAGCWRFGVENPIPSVSVRCALFGNSKNIMFILKEAEKVYGKSKIKIDSSALSKISNLSLHFFLDSFKESTFPISNQELNSL